MEFNIAANPSRRTAYVQTQTPVPQARRQASAPIRDAFSISPEARAAMAEQTEAVEKESVDSGTITTFTSFAGEFSRIVRNYSNTLRTYYAQEHVENLTYSNPHVHIWDKYKNPESPSFRSELSEDERAWAYDQELDLLNGGKHLQMGNPYAFPDGAPTLASAAMQANQSCRAQISQSIQDLLVQKGIELPSDASFRLTVDDSCAIHVTGLEDDELAQAIEAALNAGDNGKNLYGHLKITGDAGANYADGRLEAVDPTQELTDETLAEVKKQISPAYSQFSDIYNPHQEPLGVVTLPGCPEPSQEEIDRLSASVRVGMPEVLARLNAGEFGNLGNQELVVNRYAAVDPDGSIRAAAYIHAYAQQTADARKTIEDYYAAADCENRSYPEPLNHLAEKYKLPWSDIFRSDLSERQRDMYYRQERALLTGARVTLLDPYALASVGGVQNMEDCHEKAMQAVREKLDALWEEMYGIKG